MPSHELFMTFHLYLEPTLQSDTLDDQTLSVLVDKAPFHSNGPEEPGSVEPESDSLEGVASRLVSEVLSRALRQLSSEEHSLTATVADDNQSITSDSHLSQQEVPTTPISGGGRAPLQFQNILQKDCFLVFRSLCKLSMKGISDVHDRR